ncbi:MAG TPA: pantoate--beta-alanine ligase [Cyclobacteriaceae bacterium]
MKIATTVAEYKEEIGKSNGKIGFVPTMGALHDGHLRLIDHCKRDNDITVVSIFVNPKQFNDPNDYLNYPIKKNDDLEKLQKYGVDICFLPTRDEIYKNDSIVKFDFGYLENIMEGKNRPGHFNGVAIVLTKLFNIIDPKASYFGQKDIQQLAIVKKLVDDLFFNIDIIPVPTVRTKNGLALSSRNLRLNLQQQIDALVLIDSLSFVRKRLLSGEDINRAVKKGKEKLTGSGGFELEYLEVVDSESLLPVHEISNRQISICGAGNVGNVRLIDNIFL